MAISDLVGTALNKPVAAAARLARRALERIAPLGEGQAERKTRAAPRKSKGWRKHVRRVKARERSARG
jgi:hypothetical protein